MKRIQTLAAAAVLSLGALSAQAQTADGYEFRPHWYLGLQGGVQHTLGEAKFGDLLSPNVQAALGYQANTWLGLRLSVNAWQSKGGWNGYKPTPTAPAGNVTYKFKYVAPSLDVMFNLSNLLCGWNPMRTVSVSAFVGGGANWAGGNTDAVNLAAQGYDLRYLWTGKHWRATGRGGVAVDFRLNDYVSLGLEGNANVLSDKYNSKKAGNADWYFNALAGVKINLGKTYRKKAEPAARPVEPVQPQKAAPVEQKAEPVIEKRAERLERNVFFTINSSAITATEEAKVSELASFLKANPASKAVITGYADAGTGTDQINDRISAKRAEAVKTLLTDKYGIDAARITTEWKGSRQQPFADNDKNRVSVGVVE